MLLAVKSALTRPSSLAAVAAAGFGGGWLLSRSRKDRKSSEDREKPAAGTESLVSVAAAFTLRYAARMLPMILSRMWAERRKDEPCTVVKSTVMHDQGGTARAS